MLTNASLDPTGLVEVWLRALEGYRPGIIDKSGVVSAVDFLRERQELVVPVLLGVWEFVVIQCVP